MTHIARSTLILTIFFAIDKVFAFLRQIIIARQFGLSPELDAFNAANNVPDLLFAMISGGALAIALIPVLSEYLQKGGQPAFWDLFSRIANLSFLATAGLALLFAVFAGFLVRWEFGIAPGFTADQQNLAVNLMRLNFIATLIFSLSGLVMAGLQANQHFLLPAMAPALYNLGQIFGALVLAPKGPHHFGPVPLPGFGFGIQGLVYGVILGAVLHLSIQIPGLFRYKFRWTPAIGIHNRGVIQVLNLMGPRLLTMLFIQLIFIARDNFASRLEAGAVTALTYGWFIMQVPETLIGTAIATALLPSISEQLVRGERDAFRQTVQRALKSILALTIPAAALISIAIRPLVQIAFDFDAAGTDLVVWCTRAFLLGLMGEAIFEVAARSFYAQQNARTPVVTSALRFFTFIVSSVILIRPFGPAGIGLAYALAITVESLVLLSLLNRRFPGILRLGGTLPRVVAGAAGGVLVVYLLMNFLPLPLLPLTVGALAVGALAILPFAWPEVKSLVKL
ncbi:MAG: murein biosynthesis integral membrane protein MurJ [Omnitrophica WOR_2 bacterium]